MADGDCARMTCDAFAVFSAFDRIIYPCVSFGSAPNFTHTHMRKTQISQFVFVVSGVVRSVKKRGSGRRCVVGVDNNIHNWRRRCAHVCLRCSVRRSDAQTWSVVSKSTSTGY